MSNDVRNLVVQRKVGDWAQKYVLLLFANIAAADGSGIWLSKPTIAGMLEIGRTKVFEAIAGLKAEGLVLEVGQRKCSTGFTIEYALDLGAVERLPRHDADPADDGRASATRTRSRPPRGCKPS